MKNNDTVQNEKNCRDSNIELLRLLAGCAVIILHYNFLGDGGAVSQSVGVNYYFLLILEIICATAVNIFILITGYFNCSHLGLKSLKGAPTEIGGFFSCCHNPYLHSLEGLGKVKGEIIKDF